MPMGSNEEDPDLFRGECGTCWSSTGTPECVECGDGTTGTTAQAPSDVIATPVYAAPCSMGISWYLWDANEEFFADCGEDQDAARRIAAALNHCAGIPTETLEKAQA